MFAQRHMTGYANHISNQISLLYIDRQILVKKKEKKTKKQKNMDNGTSMGKKEMLYPDGFPPE